MLACVSGHVHLRLKDQLQFTPLGQSTVMLETKSLLGPSLMIRLNWLVMEAQASTRFHLVLGLQMCATRLGFLFFCFFLNMGARDQAIHPLSHFPNP